MMKRMASPRQILAAVVVLLLISSQAPSSLALRASKAPSSTLNALLARATAPLHHLAVWVRRGAQGTRQQGPATATLKDYAALRRQNDRLRVELREAHGLIRQLGAARQRVTLVEASFRSAKVAGVTFDAHHPRLTIDRGTFDGVALGQVVVAGDDLVGTVVGVRSASATVGLLTAADSVMEVRLGPPVRPDDDELAPVSRALLRYDAARRGFVGDIASAGPREVRGGDLAVLADPRWPRQAIGFVVGAVERVAPGPDAPGLQWRLLVKPRLDLLRLTNVLVLVLDDSHDDAARQ